MDVCILRHARADFRSYDEDLNVSEEGEREMVKVLDVAKKSMGFKPTLVVTSSILRAKDTAEIVRKRMGGGLKVVVDKCLMPDSSPGAVVDFLGTLKKDESVVLVSHMPIIIELLYELIGGRGEVELLNGSMATVQFKGKAAPGKGKLMWLIQPQV